MKLQALLFCITSLALFGQAHGAGHKPNAESKPKVQFTTNLGPFTVELEPQAAPKTVENFLGYARKGFYNGTTFHRVISTFMVQGGGHDAATGKEKATEGPVVNEARRAFEMGLKNDRGAIAMARTAIPDSATCQFFINVADNAFLDYPGQDGAGYCVFGRVVEGMETIDKIKDVRTGPGDRPVEAVVITGTKAIAPDAKKQAGARAGSGKAAPKAPSPKNAAPKNKAPVFRTAEMACIPAPQREN